MKSSVLLGLFLCFCAPSWAQSNPVARIDQPLFPTSAVPGGPAFSLKLNGTGFVSSSIVNWNGQPRKTTFVSGTQLSASISASDITSPGSALVTVFNPAPGGGTSNLVTFEIGPSTITTGLFGRIDYSAKSLPVSTFVGDFNGDGILDMAMLSEIQGLRIMLGNGDGSFRSGQVYSTGIPATSVTGGDFNRDGKLDLAVTSTNCKFVPCPEGELQILLGNGNGTFQKPATYLTGQEPQLLAALDLNGDGKLDLITGNNCSSNCDGPVNALSVLLGNGNGTFQPHTDIQLADAFYVYAMAVGDINGDGKPDLLTANYCFFDCAMSVLLGNGDGTFRQGLDIATAGVADVTLADLNGDGRLDLAVTEGHTVGVFLGNGDSTFQSEVRIRVHDFPESITVGDFNNDGKLDLAITDSANLGNVSILMGNGDGTFLRPLEYPAGTVSTAHSLIVGDFNRDGRTDLVTTNINDATVSVLLQGSLRASKLTLPFAGPVLIGTRSAPEAVRLTNIGTQAVHITSVGITGTDSGDFAQSNDCGTVLAPGASCNAQVTFSPTAIRRRIADLTVTDASIVGQQSIPLRGEGTVVSLSPPSLNFGNQAVGTTSDPETVTMSNLGASKIKVYPMSLLGPNAADFAQTNTCGQSLAAGASCSISVTFTPSAKGTRMSSLSVSDTGGGSPQKVPLAGTGG